VAYLAAHGAFLAWWERAVAIPASFELAAAGSAPLRPVEVMRQELGGDLGLLILGGVGFAALAARSLRAGAGPFAEAWLGARSGAMGLLALLWGAFSAWTFGGIADLYALLPLFAFFAGCAASEALRPATRLPPPGPALAGALVLALAAALALRPSAEFLRPDSAEIQGDPLARQRRLVAAAAELAGKQGPLVAISAEEVYVLREVRAPVPFLRLSEAFVPFLHLVGFEGCRGAIEGVLAAGPSVVVMRAAGRASACERTAGRFLADRGYQRLRLDRHLVAWLRGPSGPRRRATPRAR
jgi:hypothetical protein